MPRHVELQVLRGIQANVASANLGFGEMYFATDTFNLFFGTPGIGLGYIQIGNTIGVNETLLQILNELRSMRLALTKLACDGGQAVPADFDPQAIASDGEIAAEQQI